MVLRNKEDLGGRSEQKGKYDKSIVEEGGTHRNAGIKKTHEVWGGKSLDFCPA